MLAIVLGEHDAERFAHAMHADAVVVSATSLVEAAMVAESRHGPDAPRDLQLLLERFSAEVAAVDAELTWAAYGAWRRFGKGRHPAGLNFGDCFSYALAKSLGIPLLFKGDDFAQTDVARA